ncbi:MAG: hypothetical protein MK041_11770 [Aquabacterium sp.]|nr:hypothetical protein [Aquabacterium sp.]
MRTVFNPTAVLLTAAEYAALATKDPGKVYVLVNADDTPTGRVFLGGVELTAGPTPVSRPVGWNANFLAKLKNHTSQLVRVGIVGDSIAHCGYVSNIATKSWPHQLRSYLQATYSDGGSGFQGIADSEPWLLHVGSANVAAIAAWKAAGNLIGATQNGTGTITSGSNQVTGATGTYTVNQMIGGRGVPGNCTITAVTGSAGNYTLTLSANASASGTVALFNWTNWTATHQGPGGVKLRTKTANERLTWTVRGTNVDIYTYNDAAGVGADWRYRVDGGAWTTVTNDSAGVGVRKTTVTGLGAGTHTVDVESLSDGTKTFCPYGVSGYNDTGVVVHRFCAWGAFAGMFNNNGGNAPVPSQHNCGRSYPVDLAINAIGVNDIANSGTTLDTYIQNMQQWAAEARQADGAADLLFVSSHGGTYADGNTQNYRWSEAVARVRDVAQTLGGAHIESHRHSWRPVGVSQTTTA